MLIKCYFERLNKSFLSLHSTIAEIELSIYFSQRLNVLAKVWCVYKWELSLLFQVIWQFDPFLSPLVHI